MAIQNAELGTRAIHRRAVLYRNSLSVLGYVVRCLIAFAFLIPFYWVVITSLKQSNQVFTDPPQWLPSPVMWSNYAEAFSETAFPFLRLLRNSLFYVVLSTTGTLLSSLIVAYGFARIEFSGKDLLFGIMLSTMMLPGIVTLIPTYVLFRTFGWVGSYIPLIVPAYFSSPFNVFLLRQFLMGIPWDLTDAAKVDGASEFYILTKIIVPLVKPALLVVGIFHFMWTWNDFMGPLIYLDNAKQYPLVLGLSAFQTQHGAMWNLIMCASVATTLPLIVLFFIAQRYFIEGVVLTGLKA